MKGITAHAYSDGIVRIAVPVIPSEFQRQIDYALREATQLTAQSRKLVHEAKANVEALIEGQLDVEGILARRIQSPTWEDIQV